MIRIIQVFVLCLFTTGIYAQLISQNSYSVKAYYSPELATEFPEEKSKPIAEEKAPGSIIFSANFANSLGSWTTSGPDAAIWQHDDDGPSGPFSNGVLEIINSQSVNNGFAIFDADLANNGSMINRSGNLISPLINLSNINYAYIQFAHKYRFCCDDAFIPKVEVSTNDFLTYASFDASIPGVEPNMISETYFSKINIASFLDTASNKQNFKLRFNWDGSNGGSHYYWQIDDVKVREAYSYDLSLTNAGFYTGQMEIPYFFIPKSQYSPLIFRGTITNDGGMPAENAFLNVTLDQGGGNINSNPINIDQTQSQNVLTDAFNYVNDTLVYFVNYNVQQDSSEALSVDNSFYEFLNVTRTVFSADNNAPSGFISNLSNQPGQPFKVGNVMEILNNDVIDSMFVYVTATSTNIGAIIHGELFKKVNGIWNPIGSTLPRQIGFDDNGGSIGLKFPAPILVAQGDNILVAACHNGGSPDVRFRVCQRVENGFVQGFDANGANFILENPKALMVRLNMGELLSINEFEHENMLVYPNPTNGLISISALDDISGNVEFIVLDASGKEVNGPSFIVTELQNGKKAYRIDLSKLDAGLYEVLILKERSVIENVKVVKQ